MAAPIIGKVEFRRTADGQTLLTVDPDSTWELLKVQMPGRPTDILMMITTDDVIRLLNGKFFLRPSGQLALGGNGETGGVSASNPQGVSMASLYGNGEIRAGAFGQAGSILVRDASGHDALVLSGQTGDIILQNADCAEDFDLVESAPAEPGAVMVLDDDGKLRQSERPYDKKVAGVVSGAGAYRPGIVLGRSQTATSSVALAMLGKVFCKVDATHDPIAVGDLLTTSSVVGHAMRAGDPARAFGAVIGKALRPWHDGLGLIPILVALQ
jgi:hypothetical protein